MQGTVVHIRVTCKCGNFESFSLAMCVNCRVPPWGRLPTDGYIAKVVDYINSSLCPLSKSLVALTFVIHRVNKHARSCLLFKFNFQFSVVDK